MLAALRIQSPLQVLHYGVGRTHEAVEFAVTALQFDRLPKDLEVYGAVGRGVWLSFSSYGCRIA